MKEGVKCPYVPFPGNKLFPYVCSTTKDLLREVVHRTTSWKLLQVPKGYISIFCVLFAGALVD